MNPLRLSFLSLLTCALAFVFAGKAQSQILFYDFDDMSNAIPTESNSKGSSKNKEVNNEPHPDPKSKDAKKGKKYRSRSGQGVTGQSGDFALDLGSATMMGSDGFGGAANVVDANQALSGLRSFTLCGWFYVEEPVGYAARLFEMYNVETQGFFLACAEDGCLALEVNKHRIVSKNLDYRPTKQWVFFAVTFNGTQTRQNVVFYMGTKEKGLTSYTGDLPVENPLPAGSEGGRLTIGNSGGYQRPIRGFMDNIAIYGSPTDASGALSETEIKTVFQSVVDKMKSP